MSYKELSKELIKLKESYKENPKEETLNKIKILDSKLKLIDKNTFAVTK